MPNWTDNTLTVIVPKSRKEAFLAAIEGPGDWPMPVEAFRETERPNVVVSNHTRIQTAGGGLEHAKLMADFRAHMASAGWADWMKPSQTDLEIFLSDPAQLRTETVPFSVARLAPWKDKEEFDRFFPSADPEAVLWSPKSDADGSSSPIIDLRHHKIGPKWPPGSIEIDVDDSGDSETCAITITYQTPWSPLRDIAGLLEQACKEHGAKFLLTWVEEQGYCGYTFCNPAEDIVQEQEWDTEHGWYETITEEDGDEFQNFDRIAFETEISEMTSDPDL